MSPCLLYAKIKPFYIGIFDNNYQMLKFQVKEFI